MIPAEIRLWTLEARTLAGILWFTKSKPEKAIPLGYATVALISLIELSTEQPGVMPARMGTSFLKEKSVPWDILLD